MSSNYPFPWILYHERWRRAARELGDDHPVARAAFGRAMGRRGRVLSVAGSGRVAWVANYRIRGHSGFQNRSFRRHQPHPPVLPFLPPPPGAF